MCKVSLGGVQIVQIFFKKNNDDGESIDQIIVVLEMLKLPQRWLPYPKLVLYRGVAD